MTILIGHADMITDDCKRLAFRDVPQIPETAERWEDGRHVVYDAEIDGLYHRWRCASDGATLLFFCIYRPKPKDRALLKEQPSAWIAAYVKDGYST